MTGFARSEGASAGRRWVWELKSVNGRGLEFRFRTPAGMDSIEPELRRSAAETFSRGSINASLSVESDASATTFKVNWEALGAAVRAVEQIRQRIDCEKPRAEGLLALKGVIEQDDASQSEEARADFAAAVAKTFRDALSELKSARDGEGAALARIIAVQIDEIERLAATARSSDGAGLDAIRSRISSQLQEFLAADIPADRVAQEAALLAIKADVREELDRIAAHVAAARALLAAAEPVGRRFDFLAQEFNREANTLCSKAQHMDLKRIGLDLKSAVDRLREQIQNVE